MGIIDKNNGKDTWESNGRDNGENNEPIAQQLVETVSEGKGAGADLRQLLKGYFSMIDNLDNLDFLKDNLNDYQRALNDLGFFSRTVFMEKKAWRVYDNGEVKESCGAHLRNLLTPFKNLIAMIKSFSGGGVEERILKSFIENSEGDFEQNKKRFLEFCVFLEKENK